MSELPPDSARQEIAELLQGVDIAVQGIESRLQRRSARGCVSAWNKGSDAILVQLRLFCTDEPGLKQIDFSPTIHLTFDELEACDLAFSLLGQIEETENRLKSELTAALAHHFVGKED